MKYIVVLSSVILFSVFATRYIQARQAKHMVSFYSNRIQWYSQCDSEAELDMRRRYPEYSIKDIREARQKYDRENEDLNDCVVQLRKWQSKLDDY
jgi:hypothetical protein